MTMEGKVNNFIRRFISFAGAGKSKQQESNKKTVASSKETEVASIKEKTL